VVQGLWSLWQHRTEICPLWPFVVVLPGRVADDSLSPLRKRFGIRHVAEVPGTFVTSEKNLMAHLCANNCVKRCSIVSKYQFGLPEVQHELAG